MPVAIAVPQPRLNRRSYHTKILHIKIVHGKYEFIVQSFIIVVGGTVTKFI